MNLIQRITILWSAQRVNYLDNLERYEDSYAVSQEFCEWTSCLNVYPDGVESSTLNVPDFNKGNRTSLSMQL